MKRFQCTWLLLAGVIAAIPFLAACRVGRPFRGPGYDPAQGVVHPSAGRSVFVAVTRGDVQAGKGEAFSRQLRAVLSTMDQHDGLIGYAVRKELVGSRVWTMSAWVDRESMESFAQSPAHREAIARGGIPRSAFVAAFVDVEADRVPLSWAEAERLLRSTSVSGVSSHE